MKKMLIVFLIGILLCGCHEEPADEVITIFSLSRVEQDAYKGQIKDALNSFYWHYDEESLEYYSGKVPDKTEVEIFDASSQSGFDLVKHSAKDAVVFSTTLTHFNGEEAGKAYFYFLRDELIGLYYVPSGNDEIAVSLGTRNVFAKGVTFDSAEGQLSVMVAEKVDSNLIPSGFISKGADQQGNNLYINIENNIVYLYRFTSDRFLLARSISYFDENLVPISAAFISSDEIAVIVGTPVMADGEHEEDLVVSEKVIFFDSNLNPTGEEYLFTGRGYVCVGEVEGEMALMNGRHLETFSKASGKWELKITYELKVSPIAFKEDDINGDGIKEYIMTDGKDFYVYQKTSESMKCIFRTNISLEFFGRNVYTGDFNYDGIKEVYLLDNTGTAIRYILSEHGMVVQNDDIEYGVSFHVDDFNNDGLYDYIKIENDENLTLALYMGRE